MDLKIAPYAKFELDHVIILKIIQVSLFFNPKNDLIHWKQKVAMTTPYCNGYWRNTQNVRQRCKVKVRKLLFNISWRFGVMEEKPLGRRILPLVLIGLNILSESK